MRNYIFITALVCLTLVFSVSSAKAQKGRRITAQIPFQFSVQNKKFEPGKYHFVRLSTADGSAILHLYSYDEKTQIILRARPVIMGIKEMNSEPSLVFNRYGDDYFLSAFSDPAEGFAVEIRKSKIEIQRAKKFSAPDRKTIAFTRRN